MVVLTVAVGMSCDCRSHWRRGIGRGGDGTAFLTVSRRERVGGAALNWDYHQR
jgi:hypothetical protein